MLRAFLPFGPPIPSARRTIQFPIVNANDHISERSTALGDPENAHAAPNKGCPVEANAQKVSPGTSAGAERTSLDIGRVEWRARKLTKIFDGLLRLACGGKDRLVVAVQNFEP